MLTVHRSNFEQRGFVATPEPADLAALAREAGLPYLVDVGSGLVVDLEPWGLRGEPRVQDALAAGADLVLFSGDKLLGGPQAGCLVGRGETLARCREHPIARAVRADKLTLAGLEATLALYRDPAQAAARDSGAPHADARARRSLPVGPERLAALCPAELEPFAGVGRVRGRRRLVSRPRCFRPRWWRSTPAPSGPTDWRSVSAWASPRWWPGSPAVGSLLDPAHAARGQLPRRGRRAGRGTSRVSARPRRLSRPRRHHHRRHRLCRRPRGGSPAARRRHGHRAAQPRRHPRHRGHQSVRHRAGAARRIGVPGGRAPARDPARGRGRSAGRRLPSARITPTSPARASAASPGPCSIAGRRRPRARPRRVPGGWVTGARRRCRRSVSAAVAS